MPSRTKIKQKLLAAARKAALSAYAPYSNFRVGAAVIAGGRIYTGSNVENASYGLTMCAERVAILSAISDGARKISALAVSCIDAPAKSPPEFRMPCGACRQVIAEFADKQFDAIVDGVGEYSADELLPQSFKLS